MSGGTGRKRGGSPGAGAQKMSMPRPDEASKDYLRSIVPDDPRVKVKPMFGNLAAFVNGNMFMGLFGNEVFVRLGDEDRAELMGLGGGEFEPMPGRPMRGYVTLPGSWRDDRDRVMGWVERSLTFAGALAPK